LNEPAVAMSHICKRFGELQANDEVDLHVARGTVHGIVGENGAGKSTLMSILYGFYQADSGEIAIDGRLARIRHSKDAIALGIGMVHQHFMLVETFSALDNVLLGAEPSWRLKAARDKVRRELEALMRDTGLAVRLDAVVETLPVGERQRLEILKALYRGARILILDEPTAVLTPAETETLFATLAALRARGTTILLITHKLKEVAALCDRVTVMRGGRVVLDVAMAETTLDGLAEAMVGRRVQLGRGDEHSAASPEEAEPPLLAAHGLHWRDDQGVARLDGVSLALRPGEIVGIAGVSGNGQSELLDVLAGLSVPTAGRLELGGRRFEPGGWLSPRRARRLGLAHVPEDRHRRGLVLGLPAWESAVLGYHRQPRYARAGLLRRRTMRADTDRMMADYDVRPRAPNLKSAQFSGGNQQKLVLAREALHRPTVLLVGQPTRGVDIGAIEFIHGRLRALRDAGGAVLLVSSELDEILALADRVIVMAGGRIAGELPIAACDEATLGKLMAGVHV
jgi:general nucleoside transport system ATP-binding protein